MHRNFHVSCQEWSWPRTRKSLFTYSFPKKSNGALVSTLEPWMPRPKNQGADWESREMNDERNKLPHNTLCPRDIGTSLTFRKFLNLLAENHILKLNPHLASVAHSEVKKCKKAKGQSNNRWMPLRYLEIIASLAERHHQGHKRRGNIVMRINSKTCLVWTQGIIEYSRHKMHWILSEKA